MDARALASFVDRQWDDSILPALLDYVRIPNKSPAFDPGWRSHGHMARAVSLIADWCRAHALPDMTLDVVELDERTPIILIELPGSSDDCVLLYGHLDKQPEMTGWREHLGPWKPVLEDDKLYGRGGADDGYAAFAALTALRALATQSIPRARCVILIEACEESGSYDLPHYIDALGPRIGEPSLVICLDSGCGNYDQLWATTSLRGSAGGTLSVEVLTEGVHSGDAGGIVPSSFRILRHLLSRLEDDESGRILPPALHVEIPTQRVTQAHQAAEVLGEQVYAKFPFREGVRPIDTELAELVLNRTWRPALSITGADGFPAIADAGNVTRPRSAVKVSLRIPPTCDPGEAARTLKTLLERDPPYGARVSFDAETAAAGWNAPALAPWLEAVTERASATFFGRSAVYMGEGGTIPFMGMLGEKFPNAQFLITGVLGPHSNAHGPNEFLHLPTGKRLTACVAAVIAGHQRR